jgi:hypothetical protein
LTISSTPEERSRVAKLQMQLQFPPVIRATSSKSFIYQTGFQFHVAANHLNTLFQ